MTRINGLIFFLIPATAVAMTMLYGGVHQPILALFYLMAALMVVLWAAESSITGRLAHGRSLLQVPLIALGCYALIQLIPFGTTTDPSGVAAIPRTISADPFATQLAAVHVFGLAAFFGVCLAYVDSAKRLQRLAAVLTIFGFAYAFFAVLQSVLSPEAIYGIYRPTQARPFGTFVNRNDFAAIMVLLSSLPLGLLFTGAVPRDKRLLYIVAVALMATALLLSQSRGGLVVFVCEVMLLVIFTSRAHGRKKWLLKGGLALALLAAAIGGAVFVGGETSLKRFTGSELAVEAPSETTSRFHMWSVTTRMIAHSMPFGVGLGAFPAVYPQFDTASGMERVEQAHNDYLQLPSDAGLVGIALGALFLYLLVRQGRAGLGAGNQFRRGIAAGALAGISAVLLHSLFDFVLHITAVALVFLILLGMLVASGRSYKDDVEDLGAPSGRRRRAEVKPLRRAS